MKPKRFYFRSTQLFGAPLRCGAPVFVGLVIFISGLDSDARDILRGSAAGGGGGAAPAAASGAALTRSATDAARANSKDILRRSGQTLDAIRAMQNAARAAALNGPNNLRADLPEVPNGLRPGGLNPTANPAKWTGAGQPVETASGEDVNVTIKQTTQQALLEWQTFNVGKKTTLNFDQSAGGENAGQWIAFNRVNDPSGNPTQILGNIKADGQVYLINRNGVIFGGSSQVNARGLTVSSLPVNTNLIENGLLNNRDAQFLFSGLFVPGGSDGTKDFTPEAPPESGKYGDVSVQPGAILKSPAANGGNGGRITLVGSNVTNAGSISTESGQTILAAGLQVAVAAHDGNDPSLRGLDVWVGAVGDDAGTAVNSGIIEALTGSASVTARTIEQLGVIESSTSVNLNGRIDLKASYGAAANPNYDSNSEQGAGGPAFLNQYTGLVKLGGASLTRILPDYASTKAVPGTALPERSQVNIEGLAIHFDKGSTLFAPNAKVSVRAGVWPYKDADGDRTIFDADGEVQDGITNFYSGATQRFLFEGGQIYVDSGATINVAGSTDVLVPLAHSILEVELRGSELADSPLQRDSNLRGKSLTVDIRESGSFNGKFWVGTPLGDVTGLAGLIERNAAQLTAVGGDISLESGGSIVLRSGSTLDVSGGFFSYKGGLVKTSTLISNGRRIAIQDATPDQVYDGVFNGRSVYKSEKWGVTQIYSMPLFSATRQQAYDEGAAGGALSLTAPGMAIDGELRGLTVEGPRQRSNPTASSSLRVNFEAEKTVAVPGTSVINFLKHSPTAPLVSFSQDKTELAVPEFSLVDDLPAALPAERLQTVTLSPDLLDENGFGSLEVVNPDGGISVPANVTLAAAPKGSVVLSGSNVSIQGAIIAPGGKIGFTTYNISPSFAAEYPILNPAGSVPFPLPVTDRGMFVLGELARLSTAGLVADDSRGSRSPVDEPISSAGGEISLNSYHASLAAGSVIDVSGGVSVSEKGSYTYGKGGAISLVTGTDTGFTGLTGGTLTLESTLRGYSGSTGGSLAIQASRIEVGGAGSPDALNLAENFFRTGGFTSYSLTGIGSASTAKPVAGQFESYIPAISIAPDTTLRPLAENLIMSKSPAMQGLVTLRPFINADGLRSPVSLNFTALGSDDPFTLDQLEVRGDIVMGDRASIVTEPGAKVLFKGGTLTLLGSVIAPGGKISVAGAGSFPLTTSQALAVTQALPTVHLGKSAQLSVAGGTVLKPDAYGRRVGSVLDGGTITISGNILAEKGGLLDASGSSGVLDLSPAVLAGGGKKPAYLLCGINIPPCKIKGVATRVASNGGVIDLSGSQMLLSDATLLGGAGGASATAGTLLVSSGRYYASGAVRTGADINLIVTQSGNVVVNPDAAVGVGVGLTDQSGDAYGNLGYFSLDRFSEGSFASLSLGGKYFGSAFPIPYGGNVEFQGKIDLNVSGALRLAGGGVITADDSVKIHSSYLAIGQDFRAPQNPDDVILPFQQDPANPSSAFSFAPTFGTGTLALSSGLIDIGTLSLQNIGKTDLNAGSGDIRGNGTLSVSGDLSLSASKIYPTSLSSFSIFAYDSAAGNGSVTVRSSGGGEIPLSAGGRLSVYASSIQQSGILRAPLGAITLGWDGNAASKPVDGIAGLTAAPPVTKELVLGGGSVTSVAASDGWVVPFGVSPDGQTWIDPRGVNVTLSGLPEKSVLISGESVNMQSGAVVDIRGGGDLLASRWVPGNGGSVDLLGSASSAWVGSAEYEPGDLVSFEGETWSAKVRHDGQSPKISSYWTKVAESFAILPSAALAYAPYNTFNTGPNAQSLAGDPGYVNSKLSVGDTVTLDGSKGLPAGTYTLLPRRYALLPGAFVITPISSTATGTVTAADNSQQVSGYRGNRFSGPESAPPVRSRFEVASSKITGSRVTYENYSANTFLAAIADKLEIADPQQLPVDAGYTAFHGNSALRLAGIVFGQSMGAGSRVDVSSFADIRLTGGPAADFSSGGVSLETSILTSWGADSLLIGGIRTKDASQGYALEVRTNSLTLDNPGGVLSATDVVLASKQKLTVADGSSLVASGNSNYIADAFSVTGDGTLLRVGLDSKASIERTGLSSSTAALMKIGASVKLSGTSIILDSTYGTDLSPDLNLDASHLTLGSGQISVVFDNASGILTGSTVDPHLVLKGDALARATRAASLTLQSYRSIDLYGTGVLDSGSLTLIGSGLRGYESSAGNVVIRAADVTLQNSVSAASLPAVAGLAGRLQIDAGAIRLGGNTFTVDGYQELALNASSGIIVESKGSFFTAGSLRAETPLITGDDGASYSITARQAMVLERSLVVPSQTAALGASLTLQATSIIGNTDILLPSGNLTLRATSGDVQIGGNLSVAGSARVFNDLTRYSSGGVITLDSLVGNVVLSSGSSVSVAAAEGGGNAGVFNISASQGLFSSSASVTGQASSGFTSGAFTLDTGSLAASGAGSLSDLNSRLDAGGFTASRSFRIRNGDVVVDHSIRSHEFSLSVDQGNLSITGGVDASGATGGQISLAARGSLVLASGARLSVAAEKFNNAGKGGSILLEAGTQRDGASNPDALLDLQQGSVMDLSVAEFVPGSFDLPGSSAFLGKFTGTLHLRAPRTASNADLQIAPLQSTITGASAVVAEGFQVYTPAGGVLNTTQRNLINTDAINFLGAAGVGNANEIAMRSKLLGGAVNPAILDSLLVIAPGAEIINATGDLTLGLANNTSGGSTNAQALASADWDLSGFRYGKNSAPGVLTLRAQGDLVFNNTLSDGFTPIAQGTASVFADNGHSQMWLARLTAINELLPTNTQSWSYRLTAGADVSASDFRSNLAPEILNQLQPGKGSVLVGEFYPAVPNGQSSGVAAATGSLGQTADTIRISTSTTNRGTRFEVVRTGTGDITVSAGRDVQLRNQFSTIYTAGVALPDPTTIFSQNDFFLPVLPTSLVRHPSQAGSGVTLGAVQQFYSATWSMAGGNIALRAQGDIGRYTLVNGVLTVDSSRQMPSNWLYRRGFVDASTGLFANNGGFGTSSNPAFQNAENINDVATSTTWWIDYSNFFQGIGTLGGGNVSLVAGNDIVNVDAVAPTNARMAGRRKNPDFGSVPDAPEYLNLAPDAENLLEHGGGDVTVVAGRNIDGGIYYVERGKGSLFAGGAITTNAARSPSLGILDDAAALDPRTWLPTTLYAGKSTFDVSARGDVLLGPVTNAFLLPQGLNNKYWYKTYFSTFSPDSGAAVASYGGTVTHRNEINLPDGASSRSILKVWFSNQNLFTGVGSSSNASNDQPWLRLAEVDLGIFSGVFNLTAPNLRSTSFAGDINLVGSWTLAPSAIGNLELAAAGNIVGLQNTGPGRVNNRPVDVWTSSVINVSDTAVTSIPGTASPLAYQSIIGRSRQNAVLSSADILQSVNRALSETGSYLDLAGTSLVKQALHDSGLLHRNDSNPVRLYAAGGDITGVTLFSPKSTRIIAGRDVTDVAFYLQNLTASDVTLVSAGRDIIPFNENASLRTLAGNLDLGNYIGDNLLTTATGDSTNAMAGDIQINGPGLLEILSGRNIDLGTGANFFDGTGVGITSIGNVRNPNLPFAGADIIALTGVGSAGGAGAAQGLSASSLNIGSFITTYLKEPGKLDSAYWNKIGRDRGFDELTDEQRAIISLEKFYLVLRDAGRNAAKTGNYDPGYAAVETLFSMQKPAGDIFARAREIRTTSGGAISLGVPGGEIILASEIFGNPLTPPGIVTEYGGAISTFTDGSVDLGQARIFTLRGGDIMMWSSNGNIAAGTSPRTVVTAPPTRVVFDISSANVQTDLGGLATGGGIGVLAAVEGVEPGNVDLIAPEGFVDAGDAGIRVTGNLNIAAQTVLNAGNISAAGTSTGTTAAAPSAPSVATVAAASNSSAATTATMANQETQNTTEEVKTAEEPASLFSVEVIGYGNGEADDEEEDKDGQEENPQ